jgi:endonuclease/exonuclease/phosphatase family metal-dependent hydrolase
MYPVEVTGPLTFNLLAVWAQRRSKPTVWAQTTYSKDVHAGLDQYRDFLLSTPSIVIGDFNIHPYPDQKLRRDFSELVDRMSSEFRLMSAFHRFYKPVKGSSEPPTYFHHRQEGMPFHVDYCFFPEAWIPRIRSAVIATYHEYKKSDHRPLTVEFTD